jgi:hypothetical protein
MATLTVTITAAKKDSLVYAANKSGVTNEAMASTLLEQALNIYDAALAAKRARQAEKLQAAFDAAASTATKAQIAATVAPDTDGA